MSERNEWDDPPGVWTDYVHASATARSGHDDWNPWAARGPLGLLRTCLGVVWWNLLAVCILAVATPEVVPARLAPEPMVPVLGSLALVWWTVWKLDTVLGFLDRA